MKNKMWYSVGSIGDTFKVRFRRHACPKCGSILLVAQHCKVVSQDSEEAKYYDFDAGGDGGIMVGPCEFIHKVFYCPSCKENIEFRTQLSIEDVDVLIGKLQDKFRKKGIAIEIAKSYELKDGAQTDKPESWADIRSLLLTICRDNEELTTCEFPILRSKNWERPYYFKVKAKP